MERRLQLFPITARVDPAADALTIAGFSLEQLARDHGTPLYLYDAATLDGAVAAYRRGLAAYPAASGLTYAGKAALSLALAQWTQRHDLLVDCTGLGEMAVARAAGLPRERLLVHGVNKSPAVLRRAAAEAGVVVVDHLSELEQLAEFAAAGRPSASAASVASSDVAGPGGPSDAVAPGGASDSAAFGSPFPSLWLRFRPGEAVATHSHMQTGQQDSKFGMGRDELEAAAAFCRRHGLPLDGLHFHLGSQFRDPEPVAAALDLALDLAVALEMEPGWTLCPGGGLGVAYHEEQLPHPDPAAYAAMLADWVVAGCEQRGLTLPHLQLEPGRSLVARAGVALYRVGAVKEGPPRRWLLLDGGMADNVRPALYGARYAALPARQPLRPPAGPATFAGPYCESGDILIRDLPFPAVDPGELVAVPLSGAYHLSMANNYNGALRPAVLWLEGGQATPVQTRETESALLARDRPLPGHAAPLSAVPLRKYQANGNDYLVARRDGLGRAPTPAEIRTLCDRRRGPGADGLLLDCAGEAAGPDLRIFNPDGGEAEKSGNGLAIYTRFLWDTGRLAAETTVAIRTLGGVAHTRIAPGGDRVTVLVGRARGLGPDAPALAAETVEVAGASFRACRLSLGNPHCVVFLDEVDEAQARRWGPLLEQTAPGRTNVEFVAVRDRAHLALHIWERGAGYTQASGTGAAAAAAAAHALGLCDAAVSVESPGGRARATVGPDGQITLEIPVAAVWEGRALTPI